MTEVTSPATDGHRAPKSPAISFEFFPPKTEEMEKTPVGGDRAPRPACAEFRFGHLRRWRLDP